MELLVSINNSNNTKTALRFLSAVRLSTKGSENLFLVAFCHYFVWNGREKADFIQNFFKTSNVTVISFNRYKSFLRVPFPKMI